MAKKSRKTETIESNEAYLSVLHWFFSFPNREMSLNNLSEALKISKTTAKRIVLQLVEEGFLKREVLGKIWRISCNQNHRYNRTRKISYNLDWIYETRILDAIHDLIKNSRVIILFGSYRKGDDTEKSDIDIAVEVLGDNGLKIEELTTLPEFGYRKNILVNLHIFSRNRIDLNLFSNIANGIVLDGFLEVKS